MGLLVGSFLKSIELNEDRYVGLLGKLMGEVEHLQNNPAQVRARERRILEAIARVRLIDVVDPWLQGLVPEENRASDHVIAALEPFSKAKGGPLEVGASTIRSQ